MVSHSVKGSTSTSRDLNVSFNGGRQPACRLRATPLNAVCELCGGSLSRLQCCRTGSMSSNHTTRPLHITLRGFAPVLPTAQNGWLDNRLFDRR